MTNGRLIVFRLLGAVELEVVLDLHARRAVPRDEFLTALALGHRRVSL